MEWKLTTLIENHEDTEEKYVCEHGFSILIEKLDSKPPIRLLMDTGQSGAFFDNAEKMGVSLDKLDALLLSHAHYDHVGGLDDLRPFGRFADIPIYSDAYTAAHLRARMPYCFVDKVYPGVPRIYLQEVEAGQVFHINRTEVLPLRVMHGRLPILGYRIGGRLGYITDMHMMPEESYEQLKGLDVLVMNALRPKPHPTHQSISEALEAAGRIGAKETYFIHMSHHAGLHADIEKQLPPHVHFAYDGLEIDF